METTDKNTNFYIKSRCLVQLNVILLAALILFHLCSDRSCLLVSLDSNRFLEENNEKRNTSATTKLQLENAALVKALQAKETPKNSLHVRQDHSSYSWIGNHWIPPPGVPTYTPPQMRDIWKHHNVLMVGDSTCRQDWATIASILEDPSNTNPTVRDLNRNINLNKGDVKELCTLRDFSKGLYSHWSNTTTLCRNHSRHKKLDLTPSVCVQEVQALEHVQLELAKEYSVLVIELGIWEIMRPQNCYTANQTLQERLIQSLESLYRMAGPNLQVFWKTVGPPKDDPKGKRATMALNKQIQTWFDQTQPKYMHLTDWGRAIWPRAFDQDRIEGDLPAHWGLEARTLNAQMLTHGLQGIRRSVPSPKETTA